MNFDIGEPHFNEASCNQGTIESRRIGDPYSTIIQNIHIICIFIIARDITSVMHAQLLMNIYNRERKSRIYKKGNGYAN